MPSEQKLRMSRSRPCPCLHVADRLLGERGGIHMVSDIGQQLMLKSSNREKGKSPLRKGGFDL